MKKITIFITLFFIMALCAGCGLIQKATSMVTEKAVDAITEAAGIDEFNLPKADNYIPAFNYDEEKDETELKVTAKNAKGDFLEFSNTIDQYIQDGMKSEGNEEDPDESNVSSVEKKAIEGGYLWHLEGQNSENPDDPTITLDVIFIQDGDDWVMSFKLVGAGNILSSMTEGLKLEAEE